MGSYIIQLSNIYLYVYINIWENKYEGLKLFIFTLIKKKKKRLFHLFSYNGLKLKYVLNKYALI